MASSIGERVRVTLFGQSHGEAIGVVVDGLPVGEAVDLKRLQAFMDRRAPGSGVWASGRQEPDRPHIVSGLLDGRTCGAPLCAWIPNTDARPGAYDTVADVPRPGHADYPAYIKHGEHADLRGGGHLSGRLTAPLCIAGGIALQILGRRGIRVGAHIHSIGAVADTPFDMADPLPDGLVFSDPRFPVLNEKAGARMQAHIAQAAGQGDSVGGHIVCAATGVPAGLGAPPFGGVENRVASIVFGIPAVRGVSFGAGFDATRMTGVEHNDPYVATGDGRLATTTNRHGGVLGGMTTGMPLIIQVAIKPTPSIRRPQRTARRSDGVQVALGTGGRHDPCIVPRAVACVEAAVAIALLDLYVEREGERGSARHPGQD